jgi:hypothetical protein
MIFKGINEGSSVKVIIRKKQAWGLEGQMLKRPLVDVKNEESQKNIPHRTRIL